MVIVKFMPQHLFGPLTFGYLTYKPNKLFRKLDKLNEEPFYDEINVPGTNERFRIFSDSYPIPWIYILSKVIPQIKKIDSKQTEVILKHAEPLKEQVRDGYYPFSYYVQRGDYRSAMFTVQPVYYNSPLIKPSLPADLFGFSVPIISDAILDYAKRFAKLLSELVTGSSMYIYGPEDVVETSIRSNRYWVYVNYIELAFMIDYMKHKTEEFFESGRFFPGTRHEYSILINLITGVFQYANKEYHYLTWKRYPFTIIMPVRDSCYQFDFICNYMKDLKLSGYQGDLSFLAQFAQPISTKLARDLLLENITQEAGILNQLTSCMKVASSDESYLKIPFGAGTFGWFVAYDPDCNIAKVTQPSADYDDPIVQMLNRLLVNTAALNLSSKVIDVFDKIEEREDFQRLDNFLKRKKMGELVKADIKLSSSLPVKLLRGLEEYYDGGKEAGGSVEV